MAQTPTSWPSHRDRPDIALRRAFVDLASPPAINGAIFQRNSRAACRCADGLASESNSVRMKQEWEDARTRYSCDVVATRRARFCATQTKTFLLLFLRRVNREQVLQLETIALI